MPSSSSLFAATPTLFGIDTHTQHRQDTHEREGGEEEGEKNVDERMKSKRQHTQTRRWLCGSFFSFFLFFRSFLSSVCVLYLKAPTPRWRRPTHQTYTTPPLFFQYKHLYDFVCARQKWFSKIMQLPFYCCWSCWIEFRLWHTNTHTSHRTPQHTEEKPTATVGCVGIFFIWELNEGERNIT